MEEIGIQRNTLEGALPKYLLWSIMQVLVYRAESLKLSPKGGVLLENQRPPFFDSSPRNLFTTNEEFSNAKKDYYLKVWGNLRWEPFGP